MTHTPGPWKALVVHGGPKGGWEVRSKEGDSITGWGQVTQSEANAALIARAPELQAESDRRLKLLRRTHDDAENHGHCPSCCMEGTGFSLFNWRYQSYVHADDCELAEEIGAGGYRK